MLSDPLSHKVGRYEQERPIIKWNWAQETPEGTITRSSPNSHGLYSYYTTFSLLAYMYGLMGSSLPKVDRREDLSLVYR